MQDIFDWLAVYLAATPPPKPLMADFNRDGTVSVQDNFDYQFFYFGPGPDAPEGWLSSADFANGGSDSVIGYCGYVFNHETSDYTVRFRHYSPNLGRWLERDPAGYVDGSNLREYALSQVIGLVDPMGTVAFNPNNPDERHRPGKPSSPQQPGPSPATPGGAGIMDTIADLFEWLDNQKSSYAKCMVQCFILEMTDEDIDSFIEQLRSDPELGDVLDGYIEEAARRGAAWPGARLAQLASLIKFVQGRGLVGGNIITKGGRSIGIEVARNKIVHKARKVLTKKLGKAAAKIGGRLSGAVTGVGLIALGVDACIAKDCHDACTEDGEYHDDEVPFLDDIFYPGGIPYRGPFRPGEPGYKPPTQRPPPSGDGASPEKPSGCCNSDGSD